MRLQCVFLPCYKFLTWLTSLQPRDWTKWRQKMENIHRKKLIKISKEEFWKPSTHEKLKENIIRKWWVELFPWNTIYSHQEKDQKLQEEWCYMESRASLSAGTFPDSLGRFNYSLCCNTLFLSSHSSCWEKLKCLPFFFQFPLMKTNQSPIHVLNPAKFQTLKVVPSTLP